jgi:hypothetical protein
MTNVPMYDIFSGTGYKDAQWLEAVEGLAAAQQRMKQLAAAVPGAYFVFSVESKAILAKLDTTSARHNNERVAS